jgi:cytochrome c-type biogenesis protein CcmH
VRRLFSATCAALLAVAPLAAAQSQRPPGAPDPTMDLPRGGPLSGTALDARTQEVGGLLRCPVCQGLSVADSPSLMARNMKAEVREQLAAGYDQEQILARFERSYGEFVRLEPRMRGANLVIWLGPLAALLGGAGFVAFWLRRSRGERQGAPSVEGNRVAPARDTLPEDATLAAAVRRVRELAYGWPGGVPPPPRAAS